MGTGTNFRIRISITTTGMGKGTTSLLSWALYSCNWKTWWQVCPWREGSGILVHLWCIPNKLVLRKDTDIIHVAMGGGVKKVFTLVEGGFKKFGGLRRGGQKSLTTKIFNCPAPPPKYLWTLPYHVISQKHLHVLKGWQLHAFSP